jgi:hypothetical protein
MAVITSLVNAADIIWVSDITDPNGADKGFVDLLTSAGHNVTRADMPTTLGAAEIAQLNAADLVIAGRANASSQFQDANGVIWNSQVTSKVIAMSAYLVRDNRMRWVTGNDLPDSGPTPLRAAIAGHPIFAGVALNPDGTMVDNYNVMIDRGTSTNTNPPVGGTVIAWNPSVQTGGNLGVAIAEWPAGTTIGGGMVLAGYRMLFNAGSREASGASVPDAGVLDLTPAGQRVFLNAVNYAIAIPEPSTALLGLVGILFIAMRLRR